MKYASCSISKKNRWRKRNCSSRSLPRRCASACHRGDPRPKRRTCAPCGTQRVTKRPVLPRVRHKKDLHDLVRTAALTATRSFYYKTVRCISIKAGDARQGGGTHLLVTDPGEPGSRTGGDACRLLKVQRLDVRRKYAPRRIPYGAGSSFAKNFFLFNFR